MTRKLDRNLLDEMLAFTNTYRLHEHEHPALREAHCLRAQYPAILGDIQEDDRFAGHIAYAPVGFRHGPGLGDVGYYCDARWFEQELAKELPAAWRQQLTDLLEYWRPRTTLEATFSRVRAMPALPSEIERGLAVFPSFDPHDPVIGASAWRIAGLNLDYDKLLQVGIPGLRQEIEQQRKRLVVGDGHDGTFYEGLLLALDLLADVCRHYAAQARQQAASVADPTRKQELGAMAAALEKVAVARPETFREAIQLFWLYALLSATDNFGRMDLYLGDFYAQDVDAGRLAEEQALELLIGLYRLIEANIPNFQARIILGGVGRRNLENADRFALLALEAYRVRRGTIPQLSLRLYRGMNPRVWATALDLIGSGGTMPMLYNDEVNVPALAHAFGVSRDEAEQYDTNDCGEYHLDHRSLGAPDGTVSLAKALEVALHNGYDPQMRRPLGLRTGEFASFKTFEELWHAYTRQIEYYVQLLAERLPFLYEEMGKAASFLYESLLYDDCLPRGKGIFSGGVRHKGLLVETYGNITTADSLTAIKELVYDKKVLSAERLLAALDANFVGYEAERSLMKKAPKYGNDDPVADAMALRVHRHICATMQAQVERTGLDFVLGDLVNVDGHVSLGRQTMATPDGRAALSPLTNANNPSGGSDRNGPTALMNSLAKLDSSNIGGQVQHMKFSKEMFTTHRDTLEQLLETYFSHGGPQAMITVVGRGDLEDALLHPEKHANLVVRVGGFSARFITLYPELQREIISRTLN